MSVGTGLITPDHTKALEAIIERDGLLDSNPKEPSTQRTREETPNPQSTPQETPPVEAAPVVEGVEEEPELDEDGNPVVPLEVEGEPAAEAAPTIDTIDALAAEFDVPVEEVLGSIMVPNGMGQDIELGTVLETWRDNSLEFATRQEAMETEFQGRLEEQNVAVNGELTKLGAITTALIDEMKEEFESVDMVSLRMSDPAEYADLIDKRHRRAELINKAAERFQLNSQERAGQSTQDLQRLQARQLNMLVAAKPEWAKDKDLAREVMAENTSLLQSMKFTEEEIDSVYDHRYIILIHEAAQYRKLLAEAKGKTLEKYRKNKGLVRPGLVARATTRAEETAPGVAKRNSRNAKFSKSRSLEDAAGVLETMFK